MVIHVKLSPRAAVVGRVLQQRVVRFIVDETKVMEFSGKTNLKWLAVSYWLLAVSSGTNSTPKTRFTHGYFSLSLRDFKNLTPLLLPHDSIVWF